MNPDRTPTNTHRQQADLSAYIAGSIRLKKADSTPIAKPRTIEHRCTLSGFPALGCPVINVLGYLYGTGKLFAG